ncbi:N-acetylglucosamine kinase [Actinoplanes sp. TFC3]|uniref:N-acetylglucosamine kinase n=1 Tax=Actinoplanes sp. TFC3 TaxID=1710355 RepID=UPI0008346784|nr:BadF/BadG/BcrA/BcrD ATPase family protein [Actinoplanes sp. TFC3]
MMLVLGVDAGGTSSRAVLSTADGTIVGRGRAGAGNPTASGATAAALSIGTAVRAALGTLDPAQVIGGVVGVAGFAVLSSPEVAAAFDEQWSALGLTCPIEMAGDAVTAFASGTCAADGAVLIAGTGAVAARITGWQIARTADGLGWLLGDEGSGLWLGLQAVRAVARFYDDGGPLVTAVAEYAGVNSSDELVLWAGRQSPAAFAGLAPLVCTLDDPQAKRITLEGAERLVATLDELGPLDGPVVLAGSLLTNPTPVRSGVLAALPSALTSRDPAAGAAWLALRRFLDLDAASAARLHGRLLAHPADHHHQPGGDEGADEEGTGAQRFHDPGTPEQ